MATDHHAEHVGSLLRPPGLRAAEDQAAAANIALQRDAGLQIFTDGEIPPAAETDFVLTAASAKVFRKDKLTNVEAEYLATQVPGQFKITMMSAAIGGMVWHPAVSAAAYPTPVADRGRAAAQARARRRHRPEGLGIAGSAVPREARSLGRTGTIVVRPGSFCPGRPVSG